MSLLLWGLPSLHYKSFAYEVQLEVEFLDHRWWVTSALLYNISIISEVILTVCIVLWAVCEGCHYYSPKKFWEFYSLNSFQF